MRLIDAYALIAEMHNIILEDGEDRRIFYEVIERQPTIEPERKTGKWKILRDRSSGQEFSCCNRCDHYYSANTSGWNFCPNCGAMNGGQTNE